MDKPIIMKCKDFAVFATKCITIKITAAIEVIINAVMLN